MIEYYYTSIDVYNIYNILIISINIIIHDRIY